MPRDTVASHRHWLTSNMWLKACGLLPHPRHGSSCKQSRVSCMDLLYREFLSKVFNFFSLTLASNLVKTLHIRQTSAHWIIANMIPSAMTTTRGCKVILRLWVVVGNQPNSFSPAIIMGNFLIFSITEMMITFDFLDDKRGFVSCIPNLFDLL